MSKLFLATGAAALAIAAPALAEKGGHGGHERGGQNQMKSSGHGNQGGGKSRGDARPVRAEARNVREVRFEDRGRRDERAQHVARNDRVERKVEKFEERGRSHGSGNDRDQRWADREERTSFGARSLDRRVRTAFVPRWDDRGVVSGFVGGCPPGLAMKNNGCLPPGQAKKMVGTVLPSALTASVLSGPYSQWYRDDDRYYYRWDDDYIYQVRRDGGLIDAFFPAIDRDYYYYPVGYEYPSDYNYYNVPYQYRSYYPDGGDWSYRYGDGAIYQVNPQTGLISGIASLLAGDLAVGQPLPADYMVYNVPYDYRDRYYDTADNWYRYNDGYIYRVDPTTQLITAVINALT